MDGLQERLRLLSRGGDWSARFITDRPEWVWITRNPERTYGPELVREILVAQPATILYDTDAHGQPDLAGLAYRVCRETGAEAVICISNTRTTLRVVAQLRQRGMTAVGPIWDS